MCSCGDGPEVFRVSRPKARKAHVCCECRGTILAGETYRNVWGVWDGEQDTARTCLDCLGLLDWCEEGGGELCTTFGNLHSDVLDDAWESGDPERLEEAKRRILAIRQKRRAAPAVAA